MGLTKRLLEKEQINYKGVNRDEINKLKGELQRLNNIVKNLCENCSEEGSFK